MTLGIECSVLDCDNYESFTRDTEVDLRKAASVGGWIFDPPYTESRCPEHAEGQYDMKPGTGEEL